MPRQQPQCWVLLPLRASGFSRTATLHAGLGTARPAGGMAEAPDAHPAGGMAEVPNAAQEDVNALRRAAAQSAWEREGKKVCGDEEGFRESVQPRLDSPGRRGPRPERGEGAHCPCPRAAQGTMLRRSPAGSAPAPRSRGSPGPLGGQRAGDGGGRREPEGSGLELQRRIRAAALPPTGPSAAVQRPRPPRGAGGMRSVGGSSRPPISAKPGPTPQKNISQRSWRERRSGGAVVPPQLSPGAPPHRPGGTRQNGAKGS